jgi:hypothetical protein
MGDDIGSDDIGDHTLTEADIQGFVFEAVDEASRQGTLNESIKSVAMDEFGLISVIDRHGRRWAVEVREL